MTLLQTPPLTAYLPTITLSATGGDGKVDLTIAPTFVDEHVHVTGGTPAPDPDCTGTYYYLEVTNNQHAFRRALPTPCRVYFINEMIGYLIVPRDTYDSSTPRWRRTSSLAGTYLPGAPATGSVVCSDIIQATYSDPAAAIAIFRHSSALTLPNRRLCRAVCTPAIDGSLAWTDTGQVGGKAGPAGGLPAGTYHYMAVPLSLDGRVGTPTADTPATVT
jgi:hypothetical protein